MKSFNPCTKAYLSSDLGGPRVRSVAFISYCICMYCCSMYTELWTFAAGYNCLFHRTLRQVAKVVASLDTFASNTQFSVCTDYSPTRTFIGPVSWGGGMSHEPLFCRLMNLFWIDFLSFHSLSSIVHHLNQVIAEIRKTHIHKNSSQPSLNKISPLHRGLVDQGLNSLIAQQLYSL